jgi:hypothetical protein
VPVRYPPAKKPTVTAATAQPVPAPPSDTQPAAVNRKTSSDVTATEMTQPIRIDGRLTFERCSVCIRTAPG